MTHKKLLRPDRQRQIPPHFSWVDHQLIRQHRLRDCDHSAWALYLFLVTVADAQGLSYYSDGSLTRALKVDGLGLSRARRQLMDAAEAWGRSHGATLALLDTYVHSEVSVPFYEHGLGYVRHSLHFHKRL